MYSFSKSTDLLFVVGHDLSPILLVLRWHTMVPNINMQVWKRKNTTICAPLIVVWRLIVQCFVLGLCKFICRGRQRVFFKQPVFYFIFIF
jgi:hypothetical protein